MKLADTTYCWTGAIWMPAPWLPRNALAGHMVMRRGSLYGSTPSPCKRKKDTPPIVYPDCVEVPACPYLLPPNNILDSVDFTLDDVTTYTDCVVNGFLHEKRLDWTLTSGPFTAKVDQYYRCEFRYDIPKLATAYAFVAGDCSGVSYNNWAVAPTLIINFGTRKVFDSPSGYEPNTFDGTIPGTPPYDLSTPIVVPNSLNNDPVKGWWTPTITLSLTPPPPP